MNNFRWTISARIVAIAWVAVTITAVAGFAIQRSVIRRQGLDTARTAMRGIILSAESIRASVGAMNSGGDFNRKALVAQLKEVTDIRTSRIYGTIPVVAAWKAIQSVADKEGYTFRVPSNNPRNPKNVPSVEEGRILAKLAESKEQEYFEVDEAKNEMVYARPILLSQDCMLCHGNPSPDNKTGKDVVGFRMEGWHAGEMHGIFLLRSKLDQVDSQVKAGMLQGALWLTPMAIIIGFCAFLATGKIRKPLAEAVHVFERFAKGDLTAKLERTGNDEIGDMAAAIGTMSASLRTMIGEISNGVEVLSSSASELNASAGNMATHSKATSDHVSSVAASAEEMSSNTTSVAAGMEQASTNLANVASATEQMTSTIGEIAGNSEKARRITGEATLQAQNITGQMNHLGTAAREIGKVTETITEISAQTNLLALNATIEAARAGSAGKGFAVVASEIKELAKQTAAATEDIKARIEGVQSAATVGIADIERVSRVIEEVSEIVSSIAAAIEEQATATKEIARNVGEAALGVGDANSRVAESSQASRDIARQIAGVERTTTEMAKGSHQVEETVVSLSHLAGKLKTAVGCFRA